MKLISFIILSIFMSKGCEGESSDIKEALIEYTANTRGFYQQITIKDQIVTISEDRNGIEKPVSQKISDADWKLLVESFKEVNLDEIPNLKAPTEKRFYDGAAIAKLKITYKKTLYETTDFDHGHPPVEIEKFVNKVVSFGKKE